MRNRFYVFLIMILAGVIIFPFQLASQNKYVINIIQPDPLVPPFISFVSTTNNNKNKIAWEIPENTMLSSVGIYRESAQTSNKWELIDLTDSKTNEYVDQSSQAIKQAYRYRISGFDKCGSQTALCTPHRTIKLMVVRTNIHSFLLTWNPYEGKNIQCYNIYRGISANALEFIASSFTTQYNDTTMGLPKGELFYRVEAKLADEVIVNYKSSSLPKVTWSNFTSILSFNEKNDTTYKNKLHIYPNPSSFQTTLFFQNPLGKSYEVTILDLTGKPVFSKTISTSQVDVNIDNLKDGMYLVRVKGEQFFEGKMVVYNNLRR